MLMQVGGCSDFQKYVNAQNAGAGATIFINEGSPGNTDPPVYLFTDSGITAPGPRRHASARTSAAVEVGAPRRAPPLLHP